MSQGGVPILSGIPLIGGLFGRAERKTNRTELYLFLTPRILKTDADADSVTAPRLPNVEQRRTGRATASLAAKGEQRTARESGCALNPNRGDRLGLRDTEKERGRGH